MPRRIIQLELVCHAAGTLVCYWFLLLFIKSMSMSLAQKPLRVWAQLPKCRVIASHLLRNVRLWDMKTLILHNTRWAETFFVMKRGLLFLLKIAFIDQTSVRWLELFVFGILQGFMNKPSIALFLLKKTKQKHFSHPSTTVMLLVFDMQVLVSGNRVAVLSWVSVRRRALGGIRM